MDINIIHEYAKLLVSKGVALKKRQLLHLKIPVEQAWFGAIVAEEAFKLGAYDVLPDYTDTDITNLRTNFAFPDALAEKQDYKDGILGFIIDSGACSLGISSPQFNSSSDLYLDRQTIVSTNRSILSEKFSEYAAGNKIRWSTAAIPNIKWAKKVFPELTEDCAVEKLWIEILKSCYIDINNGTNKWSEHTEIIARRAEMLNAMNLEKLNFRSEKTGTDLTVFMCDGGLFLGGEEKDGSGETFSANIPTEEIFTSPHRFKTVGRVVGTKLMARGGEAIDDFWLEFSNGIITDFGAKSGYERLKHLIDTDTGSHYLGEIALVPKSSPINKMGRLFHTTLFDENACCHIAIGQGFNSIFNQGDLSKESCEARGLNYSKIHVDLMFGSDDMSCIGTDANGNEFDILLNGEFVF